MSQPTPHRTDVAIVGAGVAGSALALELARGGLSVCLLENALCDARATGHLLNLMNLKREGCAPDRAEEAA